MNTILCLGIVWKQAAGLIWPTGNIVCHLSFNRKNIFKYKNFFDLKFYITWHLIFRGDFAFPSWKFGTTYSEQRWPVVPYLRGKIYSSYLCLCPSSCVTLLLEGSDSGWPASFLLSFATIQSSVMLFEIVLVCPFTEFQSSIQWASDYPDYPHIQLAAVIYLVFPAVTCLG